MIYVVRHLPYGFIQRNGYKDLPVGLVGKGEINHLNPYINEATGLYEIWKKDDEYKGMVHYRRYFVENGDILNFERAKEILKSCDVITTKDFTPPTPMIHLTRNLDEGIVEKYVGMLPEDVIEWFESYHGFNLCSMFVSKREFIDAYCEWLFPMIIPIANKFVKEDVGTCTKRNRTIGFIIECLFGYWCEKYVRYQMDVRLL